MELQGLPDAQVWMDGAHGLCLGWDFSVPSLLGEGRMMDRNS